MGAAGGAGRASRSMHADSMLIGGAAGARPHAARDVVLSRSAARPSHVQVVQNRGYRAGAAQGAVQGRSWVMDLIDKQASNHRGSARRRAAGRGRASPSSSAWKRFGLGRLGRRIVADFHSQADADAAVEAFDREVRQGREPADMETVDLPAGAQTEKGIRVDKLLALTSLADSVTDAARKLKAGAVEINGEIQKELLLTSSARALTVRVGKKMETDLSKLAKLAKLGTDAHLI